MIFLSSSNMFSNIFFIVHYDKYNNSLYISIMKTTIYINTEKTEYSMNCYDSGSYDTYTRKFTIGSFEIEVENEKELFKFIEFLNLKNSGAVSYSLNSEESSEVLDKEGFLAEMDSWKDYSKLEKSRLEENRKIRKEISELKKLKENMTLGEIRKSGIAKKIKELKSTIK